MYLTLTHIPTLSHPTLDRTDVIKQDLIQARVHRRVEMQHVPIQTRVLRLVQVCVHGPSGIGDGPGIQNAETFALEVILKVVFGNEWGGLSGLGWVSVGRGGMGWMRIKKKRHHIDEAWCGSSWVEATVDEHVRMGWKMVV